MRNILLLIVLISSFAFSAIDECKIDVYYANGILTKEWQAQKNSELLEDAIKTKFDIDYFKKHIGEVGYSYNQTNGMILDGLETYMQKLDMQLYFDGWEASKGYITSHFEDYQEHYTKYVSRIKEGHKVLVVAHSQGNLFTNEIYKRLGSQSKDGWLQEYFGVVSVASPMNADISKDTERITWDNDPVGRWVAHMGSPTADEVPDPIRRIDWKYEPCLMGEENCTMLIPEPYAKKSDLSRVIGGKYTAEELDASIFGYDLGKIDPASNVHAFTYYMGEPLAEDIVLEKGLFGFPDKMGRRKFHDPFDQNNTLQTDIAKAKIMSAIDKQLQNLEKASSQWETDQSFDKNTKDYRITVKHRKDSSIKVSARVYPFNTEGKLYQVGNEWVKASCGGEHILEEWPDQKEDEYWMIDNPQEEKIEVFRKQIASFSAVYIPVGTAASQNYLILDGNRWRSGFYRWNMEIGSLNLFDLSAMQHGPLNFGSQDSVETMINVANGQYAIAREVALEEIDRDYKRIGIQYPNTYVKLEIQFQDKGCECTVQKDICGCWETISASVDVF